MLTPEILTEALPDFNWYGGHSGRRIPDDMAEKLDDLFYAYLDANKAMFNEGYATYNEYESDLFPERIKEQLLAKSDGCCEVCGYSYEKTFGNHAYEKCFPCISPSIVKSRLLKHLFYNICENCQRVPVRYLVKKLIKK